MENEQKNIKKDLQKTIFILVIIAVVLIGLYLIDSKTDFLLKWAESLVK